MKMKSVLNQDVLIMITCSSKVVQWKETHTFEGGYFSLIKSHCRTGAKLTQVEISRCSPSYKSFTGTMKNLKALGKLNSTMYRMFEIHMCEQRVPR